MERLRLASWSRVFPFVLVVAVLAAITAIATAQSQRRVSTEPRRSVSGSIWYKVDYKNAIAVPDFDVELRSGTRVAGRATTDRNGVFTFPHVAAGDYEICWSEPGWFGDCHDFETVDGPTHAGSIHVQPKGRALYGKVVLASGENAAYAEPFFGLVSRPTVAVKGTALRVRTNSGGQFVIPNAPSTAKQVVATVGSETATADYSPGVTIRLDNQRPRFDSAASSISPRRVVHAKAGQTVTLDARASDADGDPLTYKWQAVAGSRQARSGSSLQYKAPSKPGVYPVTALVHDGHGGFNQMAFDVKVAPTAAPAAAAVPAAATPGLTCSSIVDYYFPNSGCGNGTPVGCGPNQFLFFFSTPTSGELTNCQNGGIDPTTCGQNSANAYYAAVDPNNLRTTLTDFYAVAGFNPDGTGGTRASYMNDNDLGFGRDMHFIQTGGFMFSYVTNYLNNPTDPNTCVVQDPQNAQLAADQTASNVTATVVMEWAPVGWQGPSTSPGSIQGQTPFVKFFVYDPAGNRINAAALDPYGAKFVPNLCLNCHGGTGNGWDTSSSSNSANVGASFLPFDLETYKYPSTGIDYAAFQTLNNFVNDTQPASAITELIDGWYAGSGNQPNPLFIPPGWQNNGAPPLTNQDLSVMYYYIVARSCRTCHVSFTDAPAWDTWTDSNGNGFLDNASGIVSLVQSNGFMPHAFVGYNNMWTNDFWPDPNTPLVFNCFANNNGNATNLHNCLSGVPWPPVSSSASARK